MTSNLADGVFTPPTQNSFNGNRVDYLSGLILAKRKAVKLEREAFLQILAERDTPEQVVADLVAMFTETGE